MPIQFQRGRAGKSSGQVIPPARGQEGIPLSRRRQRATLVIVCLATAVLCLDIAVVNTALPLLARDLRSGLSGVQWVVDVYTSPSRRSCSAPGPWLPARPPSAFPDRHGRLHLVA